MRLFSTMSILLITGCAMPVSANTTSLTFTDQFAIDSSNFADHDQTRPFIFTIDDPSGNKSYFTVDTGTVFNAWLDPNVPARSTREGARSLAVRITSNIDENVKDKIFLDFVQHASPLAMDINNHGETHLIGFDFRLDPNYETPRQWAMHMQVWQCCGGHPPLSLHVVPSDDPHSPVEFSLLATDDDLEARHYGVLRELGRFAVNRGKWYNIKMLLKPSDDASPSVGCVALWLDGTRRISFAGHWGYNPSSTSNVALLAKQRIENRLQVDVGVYRRRQQTTQTIYFDNLYYTDSSDSTGLSGPESHSAC